MIKAEEDREKIIKGILLLWLLKIDYLPSIDLFKLKKELFKVTTILCLSKMKLRYQDIWKNRAKELILMEAEQHLQLTSRLRNMSQKVEKGC